MAAVGLGLLVVLLTAFPVHAADQVVSTRIWPAKDYTRVPPTSKREIRYTRLTVNNPNRTVPNPEGTQLAAAPADQQGAAVVGKVPLGRRAGPSEVAATIAFLLSPQAAYISGAIIPVDGGLGMGH